MTKKKLIDLIKSIGQKEIGFGFSYKLSIDYELVMNGVSFLYFQKNQMLWLGA